MSLWAFIESKMRSCSMGFSSITPEYVQRMWGVRESFDEVVQDFILT